ncbi:hypothetical protein ACFQE7_21070 [Nonomuraea ferruginea]|uniref:hypothetical protein n=1 Tax=Nonomuraea ferruginea TaxID=46174 RepID=UPI0036169E4B
MTDETTLYWRRTVLTSQARRRLVQKTSSALGLVGTFVLLAGSLVVSSAPASAAALAVEKDIIFTCTGERFTNTSITVKFSAPDSAPAGSPFNLTLGIPALTLGQAVTTATTVSVNAQMTVTGGTVTSGVKTGAQVPVNTTAIPAGNVMYSVAVPAGATGKVTIKPTTLTLGLTSPATPVETCTPSTTTDVLEVPIGTGGGGGNTEEIVSYTCTAGTEAPATVDIKITPTMPTGAKANQDASITWVTAVQTTGDELKVPTTGFPTGTKYFATVKASGAGAPATATGEAAITGTAGQNVTLPSVTIKVKPTTTGTVTITPGDLTIGTSATATTAAIKCTAPATGLPTFTFQVAAGTPTDDPTDDPTTTPTATPTKTTTVIVTETHHADHQPDGALVQDAEGRGRHRGRW